LAPVDERLSGWQVGIFMHVTNLAPEREKEVVE